MVGRATLFWLLVFAASAVLAISLALVKPHVVHAEVTGCSTAKCNAEAQYMIDMASHGIVPIDDNYQTSLAWGYAVCTNHQAGMTDMQIAGVILKDPRNKIALSDAQAVINAAEKYLCPDNA